MSVRETYRSAHSLSVEVRPDPSDEVCWVMLAHLADYLDRNFGVDLDCEFLVITLVYGGGAEDGPQDRPQASES